jgi:hypothetical protein
VGSNDYVIFNTGINQEHFLLLTILEMRKCIRPKNDIYSASIVCGQEQERGQVRNIKLKIIETGQLKFLKMSVVVQCIARLPHGVEHLKYNSQIIRKSGRGKYLNFLLTKYCG